MPFLDDFGMGGRPVGMDAMNVPSLVRPHCLINGLPLGEIDFSGSHMALAYARMGCDPYEGDPYAPIAELPYLNRDDAKKACLIALNAKSYHEAIQAIKHNILIPKIAVCGASYNGSHEDAAAVIIQTFSRVHSRIASLFCADFGVRAQNSEAMIMLSALEECARENIAAVPMHDGFSCMKCDVDRMMDIAAANWQKETGRKPPKITVD